MFNRYRYLDEILNKHTSDKTNVITILKEIKQSFGIISPDILSYLSEKMNISKNLLEGITTFYSFLGYNKSGKYIIRVCRTISCAMQNRERIMSKLINELGIEPGETTSDNLFSIEECSCLGMCDNAPSIMINDTLISQVTEESITYIIKSCREHQSLTHLKNSTNVRLENHMISFLKSDIDITKISNYSPDEVIDLLNRAELKGRGGAGYPTGLKWDIVRRSDSDRKTLICNADEGEPGTFKDKFLLQNYPDKLILALEIAAKTIGATDVFIYLRGEYAYLYPKLITKADKSSVFIKIEIGAGAYICGEETALIKSLEGDRGEPDLKPPYPVNKGYLGSPTVVNNVETLFDVLLILDRGPDYFTSLGTDLSTGTKLFSISGDIERPGIYELPFGITINQLLKTVQAEDIKAVQVGGASGINISKEKFDSVIAYEAIPTGGSIILFDNNRRMIDIAINFLEFFINESCGMCTPCRDGTKELLDILLKIKEGNGELEDLDRSRKLSRVIQSSSRCGLGQMSTKTYLSILESNYREIESYIRREI